MTVFCSRTDPIDDGPPVRRERNRPADVCSDCALVDGREAAGCTRVGKTGDEYGYDRSSQVQIVQTGLIGFFRIQVESLYPEKPRESCLCFQLQPFRPTPGRAARDAAWISHENRRLDYLSVRRFSCKFRGSVLIHQQSYGIAA
jgi:hypothetical protein